MGIIDKIKSMKFSYAMGVFIGVASAGEPVWSLRSVNDHRTDSTIQAAYADHSTTQANSRPPYQSAALLGESESDSDSSDDEEESLLMTQGDYFKPGSSGMLVPLPTTESQECQLTSPPTMMISS